jgi:hypothetical protein
VEVANLQARDLGSPESDLKPDREGRPVAESVHGLLRRRVQNPPRLFLRERQGHSLPAIDRRPLNLPYRVLLHHAELDEVREKT